jgi:lysozyme
MQASQNAINLIKASEGLHLTPYDDGAGFQTIGRGHRIKSSETFTMIDRATADKLLIADMLVAQGAVNRLVKVNLNQNQFDALVDFTFNLGEERLCASTLLKYLNNNDFDSAANEFSRWIYAGGKVMNGLIARRAAEKQLFLTPV